MASPPNESRAFVHKSRFVRGIVAGVTGGPAAGVATFLQSPGGARRGRRSLADRHTAHGHFVDPRTGARSGHTGPQRSFAPAALVASDPDPCGFGRVWDPARGECVLGLGSQPGRDVPMGEVVMGRYGAGMTPELELKQSRICLPGMVLGDDGICYNRGQVPNARRAWPKGRKPLLTGGEMRSISIAARAARRVKETTKKLQALGMLEKPKTRSRKKPPTAAEIHHAT